MARPFGSLALALTLAIGPTLAACGDDSGGAGGAGGGGLTEEEIAPVVQAYADNVHEQYEAAIGGAVALQAAITTFVGAPSAESLEAAKAAWTAARPAYLETEVFRFYNGPIDDEATGPEGRINGWPLDENYIDYVAGADGEPDFSVGIINLPDDYPTIDTQLLVDRNEIGGEKNLSAGYHAIEFLLWGQDRSDTGPGARPYTDYLPDGDEEATAPHGERRGQYLQAAVDLLVEDLESVEAAWHPGEGGYVDGFVAEKGVDALTKILTGMGSLSGGELKSERIANAFNERDQEEEHSCFSDTTHQDHVGDFQGIVNVYTGDWAGGSKPGLTDLVAKVDPDLDARMMADLNAGLAAIQAIPVPFDAAIQDDAPGGGREKIQAAMDALQKVTDTTVEVATALGVQLNLE